MAQQLPPNIGGPGSISATGVKKGPNKWLLGCGGCAGLVVLLVVLAAIGAPKSGTVSSTNPYAGGSPSASASSSGHAPTSSAATVGTALTIQDGIGDQAVVTLDGIQYMTQGTSELAQPPQYGNYAVVEVTIRDTKGQWTADPLFFQIEEPDGTTYTAGDGKSTTAIDNQMDTETLSTGQKTSGSIVFNVKVPGGKLLVGDGNGDTYGTWSLPTSSTAS
jgi:hypothetical protein